MSYLIKTYTKTEHEITDTQEIKLRSMSGGDKIYLKDGSMLMVNNIAEIVKTKEDFTFKQIEMPRRIIFTKVQLIRALEQIIKGFKKNFYNKNLPINSQMLLNHIEKRLNNVKNISSDKKFNNPINDIKNQMWDFIHQ